MQQALRLRPASERVDTDEPEETSAAAGAADNAETVAPGRRSRPDGEAAGLFAATDGLVDAINTAAHALA